jgi:hypothetical protein
MRLYSLRSISAVISELMITRTFHLNAETMLLMRILETNYLAEIPFFKNKFQN